MVNLQLGKIVVLVKKKKFSSHYLNDMGHESSTPVLEANTSLCLFTILTHHHDLQIFG